MNKLSLSEKQAATLATFFIDRDAEDDQAEIAGAKFIDALQAEIAALRTEIQTLSDRVSNQ
jgi:voltage-gated potassium channel